MISDKALRFLKTADGADVYVYTPGLLRPYYTKWAGYAEDLTAHTRSHKVRMAIELLESGYRVYYLAVEDRIVSYAVAARGGGRLRCASKRDIVIGPVFTPVSDRGKGYAARIERAVLEDPYIPYERAWEYIMKDNAPSLRVAEKLGFRRYAEGEIRGRLRRVRPTGDGGGTHEIVVRDRDVADVR